MTPEPDANAAAPTIFEPVLVGDDGAAGGHAAAALAHALAPGATLVLVRAYPYDGVPSRAAVAAYGRLLADDAARDLARTRDALGVDGARIAAVPDSSPARALHRLAEEQHAGLIVVGSSHRGAAGRLFLGDVGRDLLHGAPCPVAVAPLSLQEPRLRAIGVAYDDSREARAALQLAAGVARVQGAGLRVVYVVESDVLPTVPGIAFDLDELLGELRDEAQAKVDAAVGDLGVPVEARAVCGTAAGELGALAAAGRPRRLRVARLGRDPPGRPRQHVGPPHPPRAVPGARGAAAGRRGVGPPAGLSASLVAQRAQRVEPRRPARRQDRRDDADHQSEDRDADERPDRQLQRQAGERLRAQSCPSRTAP